ncbi:MAG: response regulator transcription factor [Chitinophagaceae bacterium]
MSHLLLVEDNKDLGNLLQQYLEEHGMQVSWCTDGMEALTSFGSHFFDLCILDVMMPLMDGFTLAKEIHALNDQVPFIFLTARKGREDRIKGLTLLADDYITKPFDAEELVLRIQNILRRVKELKEENLFKISQFTFDYQNLLLISGTLRHKLTRQEAHLLKYLFDHRNLLIKREILLQAIWGKNDYFLGRSMDVFITRLRKYFKDDPGIQIESTRGVGITFLVTGQPA